MLYLFSVRLLHDLDLVLPYCSAAQLFYLFLVMLKELAWVLNKVDALTFSLAPVFTLFLVWMNVDNHHECWIGCYYIRLFAI